MPWFAWGLGSALTLPSQLPANAPRRGSADSCIYIFLWGGPPQQDTWDPKPDAPQGIRSQFGEIDTAVPGIRICDAMPLFARHTDKTAIIRSLSHPSNLHEPSVYRMFTGQRDETLVSPRNPRKRSHPPNFASVLSYFSPPGPIPAAVTIPRPVGHDGVTYAGTHGGFLGPKYDPLEKIAANKARDPAPHPTVLPPDVDETRLVAREGLLKRLEQQDEVLQRTGGAGLDDSRDQALRMVTSPVVRRAFDIDKEPPRLRDRYGRNEYGEAFLLARRLVESGVQGRFGNLDVHHAERRRGERLGQSRRHRGARRHQPATPCSRRSIACRRSTGPGGIAGRPASARDAGANAGGRGRRVRPHAEDQRPAGPRPLGRRAKRAPGRRRHPRRAGLRRHRQDRGVPRR